MFPLTEMPFQLAGAVYRSAMPFSRFGDPDGKIFAAYQRAGVSGVVLLTPDEENLERTGRDLRAFYAQNQIQVFHLPIPDYSTPSLSDLRATVQIAQQHAQAGHNLVVHCYAGIGRTGLFLACMAKIHFGYPPSRAINWVREYIPHAVETAKQMQLVAEF
jgi:protein-tyrosine phosphatase